MQRRYSTVSQSTLKRLDTLEETFAKLDRAVREIEAVLRGAAAISAAELAAMKARLAQLNGDLDKFQFTQVDAVEVSDLVSGKASERGRAVFETPVNDAMFTVGRR